MFACPQGKKDIALACVHSTTSHLEQPLDQPMQTRWPQLLFVIVVAVVVAVVVVVVAVVVVATVVVGCCFGELYVFAKLC